MTNTKLLRSRVMGNYHARFWSRVGRGDLSCLGNYHIKLKCYVVIELKTGKFKPEYAGKLNFYLNLMDRQIKDDSDNPTIGLILCEDKKGITVEYAIEGINKPMGVSQFKLTEKLPSKLKEFLPTAEELKKLKD